MSALAITTTAEPRQMSLGLSVTFSAWRRRHRREAGRIAHDVFARGMGVSPAYAGSHGLDEGSVALRPRWTP